MWGIANKDKELYRGGGCRQGLTGNEPATTFRADAGRPSLVFRGLSGVRQSDPDLKLVLDTGFLDSLMAKDDSHRNRALLDMAADVLG